MGTQTIAITSAIPFDSDASKAALAAFAWDQPITVENHGLYKRLLPEIGASLDHGDTRVVQIKNFDQFHRIADNLNRVIGMNGDAGGVTFTFDLPEPKRGKKTADEAEA